MVEVRITSCVITAQYGALSDGDILRTDEAFAKHLVDDCGAAKYANPRVESQAEGDKPEPTKRGRGVK